MKNGYRCKIHIQKYMAPTCFDNRVMPDSRFYQKE
jgi:hypothetical protein